MTAAAAVRHVSVLRDAALGYLRGDDRRTLLDATVGLGGHAEAWLTDPEATVIALDRDRDMLAEAGTRLADHGDRVRLYCASYADVDVALTAMEIETVDAVILDAGVASPHLDDASRGFSLDRDGPLDMRFDRDGEITAEDLVMTLPEDELSRVIAEYGEERRARTVARKIVEARRLGPIRTTLHLAEIVSRAVGRSGRIHPATRTFQAIRIAVNDELEHLRRGLEALPRRLTTGGRIAVIAFHSLEDRLVKQAFRDAEKDGLLRRITKKPVVPGAAELKANPRSRSARLRVAERTEAEA